MIEKYSNSRYDLVNERIPMIGFENEYFKVIEFAGTNKQRTKLWKCLCKCGNTTIVDTSSLRHERIKSCGCSRIGNNKGNKFSLKHGLTKHGQRADPLYELRNRILTRCYNAKPRDYPYYQGRGIKVCDEWIHNPTALREWAIANGWRKGLVLDRKDPNGDYSPNNCQFLTVSENLKKMHAQKTTVIKPIVEIKKRCFRCKCSANFDAECKK